MLKTMTTMAAFFFLGLGLTKGLSALAYAPDCVEASTGNIAEIDGLELRIYDRRKRELLVRKIADHAAHGGFNIYYLPKGAQSVEQSLFSEIRVGRPPRFSGHRIKTSDRSFECGS